MNRLRALSLFIIATLASAAYPQSSKIAENYLEAAQNKISNLEYKAAINDLTKAIEFNHPELGEVYLLRARLYAEGLDYDRALDDTAKALPLLKNASEAYAFRGDIALTLKKFSLALTEYTKALELFPDHGIALVNRAVARVELGDLDGGIADLTSAIEKMPFIHGYRIRRANLYLEKGNKVAAMKDYNAAVEIGRDMPAPYAARGNAHMLDKNYAAALADLEKALSLDRNHIDALHHLGHLYHAMGETGRSIETFTRLLKISPDAGFYYDRATAYRDQIDFDRVDDDLAKSLEVSRDNFHAKLGSAYMYLIRVSGAEAYTAAEEMLNSHGVKGLGHYAIVVGYFGYLTDNKPAQGKAFLAKWTPKIESGTFPDKLVRFLNGKLTAPQLIAAAKTEEDRTDARAIVGANAILGGRAAAAKPHLSWIRTAGKKGSWAYTLAYVLWDRNFTGLGGEQMN